MTGRPPVVGEHPLEYLRQICLDLPVPPRQLNPAVPAALEAICLRCLEKAPGDRYPSALALAEDLRQFVQGDPVSAVETRPARRSPRRWLMTAAGLMGILAAAVLMVTTLRPWGGSGHGDSPESGTQTRGPAARENPHERIVVWKLEVEHFAKVNAKRVRRVGLLGEQSFTTHLEDAVRVRAELSGPAYCYLIAFRPDGTEELCFPEQESEPPPLTDRPRYPSASAGVAYGLTDGTGLEAFFVVVSRQPLPAYGVWRKSRGESPWRATDAEAGLVWRYYGEELLAWTAAQAAGQRGKGRELQGGGMVDRLAAWLRQAPEVEAVEGIGFPVLGR